MMSHINLLILISICYVSNVTLFNNVVAYKIDPKVLNSKNGHCVLRGICSESEFGGIPCVEKSMPTPLKRNGENARAITILESVCPHLIGDPNEDPMVCCDADQLENMYGTMYNYFHLGLDRCPSCRYNFEQIFCHLMCSPNQNDFITVKRMQKNEFGDYMATELDYHMSKAFAVGSFNSCKDVTHPNGYIMDFMCGDVPREDCTVNGWFNYIGLNAQNGGLLAYKINFNISEESHVQRGRYRHYPLNVGFHKCSQSTDGKVCECADCPEVCASKPKEVQSLKKLRQKRQSETCVMKGLCGEGAFGAIPCVADSGPEMMQNPVALEELREMCPHLHSDSPNVCCTEEQIIALNRTFEMVGMFLKECPSCVRNFEKVICHLSCSTDQKSFMKITKTEKNDNGKDMIREVEYYISDDWAKGVFDSCKGVHRLGFNVLDHYCKPYKAKDCDHQKFLTFIGADAQHFGHSPFEIKFIFTNDQSLTADGVQYKPAKQPFYQCSDNPHTGEGACPCKYCDQSCSESDPKLEIKKELPKFKESRSKREDASCIMSDICGEGAFGALPCAKTSPPKTITNPVALEELKEMCPHLVTRNEPIVCCSEDQIIRLNQTFEIVSMFLKECPSCVRNFEKAICHLSCATDQYKFMKITKTSKNEEGNDMVNEVDYYFNDDWAKGIYDSCKAVHRLGFNVLDHYCKPYKAKECDHEKFLRFIGSDAEHFGHSPFEINYIFTNDDKVVSGDGVEYFPAKQSFYQCSDKPHTGEGPCPCTQCDQSCSASDPKTEIKKILPKFAQKTKRQSSGKCIMTGICGETASGKIPCTTSMNPIQTSDFDAKALEEFKQMCPHLRLDQGVCCNSEQIVNLNKSFEVMGMYLKVCPSCLRNLEKFSCHLVCSSDQEKFARIVKTALNEDNKEMALEIEYYVDDNWAKGVYESCKGIHLQGMNILDVYCRPYGKDDCDHVKWFSQTHSDKSHGGNYPFEIYFRLTKDNQVTVNGVKFNPVKEKYYQCNEPTLSGDLSCPCEHCQQSCSRKKRDIDNGDSSESLEGDPAVEPEPEPSSNNNENYCVFEGICGKKGGGNIPCVRSHAPQSLDDPKIIEMFRNICPELATSDNPLTCCDAAQIKRLESGFKLSSKVGLSLCPSCNHNFRKGLCQFACSPRQNQFIKIVNSSVMNDGKIQVNRAQYFVNNDYAQGLYDSCKDIRNGSVLNMMCGKWGRKKECSPQRLFDFMGLSSSNGGYSPFQMDFILTEDHRINIDGNLFYPINQTSTPCNHIPEPGSTSCECIHCKSACV